MQSKKKISPQAILALKDALGVIYWKKEELIDFLKLSIENSPIIGSINWNVTKRESVKELIERMTNRLDIYENDLISLFVSVTDMEDFSHLDYWDENGIKKKKAKEAVSKVRNHTTGFIKLNKEQEEARIRKKETEAKISRQKSLNDELYNLKVRFTNLTLAKDPQKRGYDLERFLYDIFLLYDLEPKGSFKIVGEQIDGAFTFQGNDYLLEAKWKRQVDRGDLASFCSKVETKFKTAVGLMISINGVTKEAISPFFKSIIIMDGADLINVLEGRISLPDLLYKKRRKASETGEIYLGFDQLCN